VRLINTDGMAFIGPGSEWFWTALTGLILAVTFFAIYRQLRIARSASAYEQLTAFERELGSERQIRRQLEILIALRDGADPADVPIAAATTVGGFWETVGGLARRGHLDPELLWQGSGSECAMWWVALEPFARARQAAVGPAMYENFEWLAGVMAGFNRRLGSRTADRTSLTGELQLRIDAYRDHLRAEEALRTVMLASPEAVQPPPPATAAVAEG
jgi:hypothetical protein